MRNKKIKREVLILTFHCTFLICRLFLYFYLGVQLFIKFKYLDIAKIRITMHINNTALSKEKEEQNQEMSCRCTWKLEEVR